MLRHQVSHSYAEASGRAISGLHFGEVGKGAAAPVELFPPSPWKLY